MTDIAKKNFNAVFMALLVICYAALFYVYLETQKMNDACKESSVSKKVKDTDGLNPTKPK